MKHHVLASQYNYLEVLLHVALFCFVQWWVSTLYNTRINEKRKEKMNCFLVLFFAVTEILLKFYAHLKRLVVVQFVVCSSLNASVVRRVEKTTKLSYFSEKIKVNGQMFWYYLHCMIRAPHVHWSKIFKKNFLKKSTFAILVNCCKLVAPTPVLWK